MTNLCMGLFGSNKNELKCKKCGTVLSDSDRLKKHEDTLSNKSFLTNF